MIATAKTRNRSAFERVEEFVLARLQEKPPGSVVCILQGEIADALGISRQAVARQLPRLLASSRVVQLWQSHYALATPMQHQAPVPTISNGVGSPTTLHLNLSNAIFEVHLASSDTLDVAKVLHCRCDSVANATLRQPCDVEATPSNHHQFPNATLMQHQCNTKATLKQHDAPNLNLNQSINQKDFFEHSENNIPLSRDEDSPKSPVGVLPPPDASPPVIIFGDGLSPATALDRMEDAVLDRFESVGFQVPQQELERVGLANASQLWKPDARQYFAFCMKYIAIRIYRLNEPSEISKPLVKYIREFINQRLAFALAMGMPELSEEMIDSWLGDAPLESDKRANFFLYRAKELFVANGWGWDTSMPTTDESYAAEIRRASGGQPIRKEYFPIYHLRDGNIKRAAQKQKEAAAARVASERAAAERQAADAQRIAEWKNAEPERKASLSDDEAILLELESRLGPQRFEMWFKDANCKIEGANLLITVATPISVSFIRANYRNEIAEAARAVTGKEIVFEVVVDPSPAPPPNPPPVSRVLQAAPVKRTFVDELIDAVAGAR